MPAIDASKGHPPTTMRVFRGGRRGSRRRSGRWQLLPSPPVLVAPAAQLRSLGSAWVQSGRAAVLVVPSAIVPEEPNLLLNPAHADAVRLRVLVERAFPFDPRMWK